MKPRMENGRIFLPPLSAGEQVVLQLRGRTSSWWAAPFVDIEAWGVVERHGMEAGADGWFCFCIGHGAARAQAGVLRLRGHRFFWDDDSLSLLVSGETPRRDGGVLVVAPHPDDAEIAAYGFYSARPAHSWVLTLTCGESGSHPAPGEGTAERTRRAEVRVAESLAIPVDAGLEPCRVGNMMLADGALDRLARGDRVRAGVDPGLPAAMRGRFPEVRLPEVLMECAEEVVNSLSRWIADARPDVVAGPHWLDTHADHRATAALLARALQATPHLPRMIYAYTVHPVYSEMEPFGAAESPADPPVLLRDATWDSFHVHEMISEMTAAKRAVLLGISDLQSIDSDGKNGLRKFLAEPRDLASYLRRAVRSNEWFDVMEPTKYIRGAL